MRILCLLFLLIQFTTKAQKFTISGKVINSQLEVLTGASIKIGGLSEGTSSDNNGNFILNLNKGNYNLLISYTGYESVEKQIDLAEDQNLIITLEEKKFILDEVLVKAVRANSKTPVTYSNIDKKELSNRNLGQDIPILLNYLPSVFSSSDAGAGVGYTYLNIRGSNSERINVTINGIPYNDAESHGTFWVNLGDFASSTENLQLQRGVGTSTNGSGAFGASLNILTDAISEKAYGEVSNSFGSYNTRKHTVKFSTGKLKNDIEVSGRLSKINSDGYVDRAFSDLKSYFLQASYGDDNRLVKIISFGGEERTYQSWSGLDEQQLLENRRQNPYTYENEVDDYNQNHYQLHWNEKISKNWSTSLGLNLTKGSGFFEQFKKEEDAKNFNNIIKDNSDVIVRRWLDNEFYVINFNTSFNKNKIDIITGGSYSNYSGDHFGEVIWGSNLNSGSLFGDRYYFSSSQKEDISIFSKITFDINNKLSSYLDLQGRFVSYQTDGLTSKRAPLDIDAKYDFFNPKAGFVYSIKGNSDLYVSYARANREANRNDFENGVSSPETLDDFELGWRHTNKKFQVSTNLYYMNYRNQLVLTGAIDDVGAPIRATSGKSFRLGLEVDSKVKINKYFSVRPNASFSSNKNREFRASINGRLQNLGNTNLSFSPNIIIGNAFVYESSENFMISVLSKYVGKQYMSNLNSTISNQDQLKGFFTSDINFKYSIETKKNLEIVINGLINNIFNKEYVDRGFYYTYNYPDEKGSIVTGDGAGFYPQATTNFLTGITLKF
jgi:iron complex outermembrane receptor protein